MVFPMVTVCILEEEMYTSSTVPLDSTRMGNYWDPILPILSWYRLFRPNTYISSLAMKKAL